MKTSWTAALICAAVVAFFANPVRANSMSREEHIVVETKISESARCIVKKQRNELFQILFSEKQNNDYDNWKRIFSKFECQTIELTKKNSDVLTLRGALFEALYGFDFGLSPNSAKPVSRVVVERYFSLNQVGRCAARERESELGALFQSRLFSEDEDRILTSLYPQVVGCSKGGGIIIFTRTGLRGMLAEALYKLRVERGDQIVSEGGQ